jgi:hypothetical protein
LNDFEVRGLAEEKGVGRYAATHFSSATRRATFIQRFDAGFISRNYPVGMLPPHHTRPAFALCLRHRNPQLAANARFAR